MAGEELERSDLEALLAARRELGPSYDGVLVDGLADRLDRVVAERTARAVEEQRLRVREELAVRRDAAFRQFALAILSAVACIPISIVLGVNDQVLALSATLLTVLGVNVAHAWQSRPRGD